MIIILALLACNLKTGEKTMPITTSSEKARSLYNEAIAAQMNVNFPKFIDLSIQALKEDPDFFMANYELAITYLYFNNEDKFIEYARNAVNCKAKLSKGELLLKDAIGKLLENRKADVTEIGKKLVEMYPKGVDAYYTLAFFQIIISDIKGEISTLQDAVKIAEKPAPIYNMLGYGYMTLGQNEDAAAAFDKYIELAPNIPNSWDSKGDYYMHIKDYMKAYDSYMKAHSIDSGWSYDKALKAKAIADSLSKK